jgi:hypothetical protein
LRIIGKNANPRENCGSNVMSIYTLIPEEVVPDPEDFDLRLTERDIYGSSRLGTENINQVIASTIGEHININTDLTQVVGDRAL